MLSPSKNLCLAFGIELCALTKKLWKQNIVDVWMIFFLPFGYRFIFASFNTLDKIDLIIRYV